MKRAFGELIERVTRSEKRESPVHPFDVARATMGRVEGSTSGLPRQTEEDSFMQEIESRKRTLTTQMENTLYEIERLKSRIRDVTSKISNIINGA